MARHHGGNPLDWMTRALILARRGEFDHAREAFDRGAGADQGTGPGVGYANGRVVLSVAFDSVLGVGSDTAAVLAQDNAVDATGNTYVTGLLYGPMDLDPAVDRPDGSDVLTPRGSTDAFVAKYAPDNTLVWAR